MSGFRNPYSTPTDEQAALVGHIVMDWAIVEFSLHMIAARLAMTPDYPGRRLTDRMTAVTTIQKIGWLVDMHRQHYGDTVFPYETGLAVLAACRQVEKVRIERNVFAHYIGLRNTDDAVDFINLGGQFPEPESYAKSMNVAKLKRLRADVHACNESLEAALSLLPETPER